MTSFLFRLVISLDALETDELTTAYFPIVLRAAATTFSVVNPNFFCKSFIGAEAPKRSHPDYDAVRSNILATNRTWLPVPPQPAP